MNDERPSENPTETRQVERDSQLSAMFDGELSAAECELLARRLTRDDALRSQWSRFSIIGAAVRSERGVALHDRVAWRVRSVIAQEASYGDAASVDVTPASATRAASGSAQAARVAAYERWLRFARPVAGASIAAGVAAMSILWLRNQETPETMLASNPVPQTVVLAPETVGATLALNQKPAVTPQPIVSNGEPEHYSTPAPSSQTSVAPQARLANYVFAHSEFSGPLSRRMALVGLVGSESDVANSIDAAPVAPAAKANDAH